MASIAPTDKEQTTMEKVMGQKDHGNSKVKTQTNALKTGENIIKEKVDQR